MIAIALLVAGATVGVPTDLSAATAVSADPVHVGAQAAAPVSESGEWTLGACTRAALDASPRLAEASAQTRAAWSETKAARAERWPHLILRGGYEYVSETMQMPLGDLVPGLSAIELGTHHAYDLRLGAEVALYTGGALSGHIAAQEATARAHHHEQCADTLLVLHEVRSGFFEALAAEAQVQAAQVAERRLDRHIQELGRLIAAGASSEEARIQAVARLRKAQIRHAEARAATRAAQLELGRRIGRPGAEIHPVGPLETSLLSPEFSAETTMARAPERPELHALAERVAQSQARTDVAQAAYLPKIVAQAAVHEGRPGVDPIADDWMSFATAGVMLEWPLWEWGARSGRVEQARAAEREAQARYDELRDRLVQAQALARVRWETAHEQARMAQERRDLERNRLDLVKGRYANGAATESERLDAEDDLAEAESAWTAALARVRLAEVELLHFLE